MIGSKRHWCPNGFGKTVRYADYAPRRRVYFRKCYFCFGWRTKFSKEQIGGC